MRGRDGRGTRVVVLALVALELAVADAASCPRATSPRSRYVPELVRTGADFTVELVTAGAHANVAV